MIGAELSRQWLRGLVKLNDRGFILTGRDVPPGKWPLPGPPLPFETSLAGVFAPGNMRYSSVKRVAGPSARDVKVRSRFRNLRGFAAGLSQV